MLRMKLKWLAGMVEARNEYLKFNRTIFEIYKGNLEDKVRECLHSQLSGGALQYALSRMAPINVLTRIIEKKSKIYASGVTREAVGGSEIDSDILNYFSDAMRPNIVFSRSNAYFNLFKNALIQPYLRSNGLPAMRVIPSDRFIPFSEDGIDPEIPTGFIICLGSYKGNNRRVKGALAFVAINSTDLVYFTEKAEDITPEFSVEGYEHDIGAVPYVYVNRDAEDIMPTQESDMLAMTLLIPVILTDINYSHMFQSFSIIYGIDLTDQGMKWGPNSFWSFKSNPAAESKPSIGTLQPQADINAGLQLVANQFALWLNTKGIKPGAVGEVNGQNFVSGISKIMDEMDTSEDRNEQIPYFVDAEKEFWDLVLKRMFPMWQRRNIYQGIRGDFSMGAAVSTNFAEQVPLVRRGAVLDDVIKELNQGLTTLRRGLKRLNPQMTESELNQLEADIRAEKAAKQAEFEASRMAMVGTQDDDDQEETDEVA